jgi:peptidoglycan/xylan/chitin deacetylase (PgdA/CDA1 family)
MGGMNSGKFVFSLDFELFWGVLHNRTIEDYGENLQSVLSTLPKVSKLFATFNARFTCAAVGMLYNNSWEDWSRNKPAILPTYLNSRLSTYNLENGYQKFVEESLLFQESLILLINQDGHELATHTYSHFFCLEPGATGQAFEADIQKAINIAKVHGNETVSIVFPRNQFSSEYLKICKQNGIQIYRGNPDSGLYSKSKNPSLSLLKRFLRLLDSYINLTGSNSFNVETDENGLVNVKASFFLRTPSSVRISLLRKLHLIRIQKAMTNAAKRKKTIHLWCHPHNITSSNDLAFIEEILKHYKSLNQKYDFRASTMKDFMPAMTK